MIVFAIKFFFFFKANSYSLEQKSYISHFLVFFCKKMTNIVYAIFVIAIKYLGVYFGNSNLPQGKSAIWLKTLAQKKKTSKYTTSILYYQY